MGSSPTWENVVRQSTQLALLSAGGAALLLGSLCVSGILNDFDPFLPAAFALVGLIALWASFAPEVLSRLERNERSMPPPRPRSASPSSERAFLPARNQTASERRTDPFAWETRVGRTAQPPTPHAGEEIWGQWSTPEMTPMGAELVGPVPETAYSPPKPGAAAPYSAMDRDIWFLPVMLSQSVDSAAPPTPKPDGSSPPVLAPPATPGDQKFPAAGSPVPPRNVGLFLRGPGAVLPLLDALDYETGFGTYATPPSDPQRGSTSASKAWKNGASSDAPRATAARICNDCSRHLADFREWVHCRRCLKPLCQNCLAKSFSQNDRGLCSDCRDAKFLPSDRAPPPTPNGRLLNGRWASG